MKRAWKIARQGQKNFGGSVKMYFSEALKQAWKEYKQGEKTVEYKKVNLSEKYAVAVKEAVLAEKAARTDMSESRTARARKQYADFLAEKKEVAADEKVYFIFGKTFPKKDELKEAGWSYLGDGNNFWYSREERNGLGFTVIAA